MAGSLNSQGNRDRANDLPFETVSVKSALELGARQNIAWCKAHPEPQHSAARLVHARTALQALAEAEAEAEGAGWIAEASDSELMDEAFTLLLTALLEHGHMREIDLELSGRGTFSSTYPRIVDSDPAVWFHCLRAVLDGDLALARLRADALLDRRGERLTDLELTVHTVQSTVITWMEGRIESSENAMLHARRECPDELLWPASLAWLWLRQGRSSAAERMLEAIGPVAEIPRTGAWLATVLTLADIAAHHGAGKDLAHMRELLLPFADGIVQIPPGMLFWGTVGRSLGLLEERLGLIDEAHAHLATSVEVAARVGAQAWLTECQIELAEFERRHLRYRDETSELLAEAAVTSTVRGFDGLLARTAKAPKIMVLGRFLVISGDGVDAVWTSRKARSLLKMLVAARGAATARSVLMAELWPGIEAAKLQNRFSVALNAVRRALDPAKIHPRHQYLVVEGDAVRLETRNLDIDLERFFSLAARDDQESLRAAMELFNGGPFANGPPAPWAVEARKQAEVVRSTLELRMNPPPAS